MNAVAFADDASQILFSGGDDGLVRVWDRRTLDDSKAKPVGILTGHTDGVTFVDSKVSIQFNSNLFPLDHGLEILNSAAMNKIVRSRERATIGHWAPKHNGNT